MVKKYFNFINSFIYDYKKFFILAFWFFIFSILVYFFLPLTTQDKLILLQSASKYIASLSVFMKTKLLMWLVIFGNNSLIFFIIFISGFLLSLFWLLVFFSQVVIVLAVVQLMTYKVGLLKTLILILPHWIFEISAAIMSLALSFVISYLIIKKIWNFKTFKIWSELKRVFKFFFLVIIPLTLFAAFVEAFITSLLV